MRSTYLFLACICPRNLAALAAASRYSLEIRVSLEATDEAQNDAVQGKGAFAKAILALRLLHERGLVPIVAVTEYWFEGLAPTRGPGDHETAPASGAPL